MSKAKTVLLVRTCLPSPTPNATQVSYQWAEAVKQQFEANGWRVHDLAVKDALQKKVEVLLQQSETDVFLFYGHGLPDQMVDQDGIVLIDEANLQLLKNQIVYVVACWTAKDLGVVAASTVRCYLGYDKEINVGFGLYAEYVEKCVNKGILAMLGTPNCTIEQARQHIINEYNHWIDHLTFSAGVFNPLNRYFAAVLRQNRDALAQVFGDEKTTI